MRIVFTIFCFSFLLWPVIAFSGTDPLHTISQVQRAMDTSDEALFVANVDMDSLVGQCVDIFLQDAKTEDQSTLPPALALILASVGKSEQATELLRSTLSKEVGEFVRYGVRSGAYAGKSREAAPPSGLLAPLFADASMGRKEIQQVGRPIAESGAVYVTFALKDHGNGNTYPVEAWLRQEEGQWKAIGLRNVRTLVRIIRQEAAQ